MKIQLKNLETVKLCGVYSIKNLLNNYLYIGSTKISFKRRYQQHLLMLTKNTHHNNHLQNAVNKYGIENFEFSIIEIINKECINNIREREKFYIDNLNCVKQGYNHSNITDNIPLTQEIRDKIKKTLKNKYLTDESYRNKILSMTLNRDKSSWNKGLICSNISNTRKQIFPDIEVYDSNMIFFKRFDNPIEIERFSKSLKNNLPIPEYIEYFNTKANKMCKRYIKTKEILSCNIHRAIRLNTFHKGLFFKKVKRI